MLRQSAFLTGFPTLLSGRAKRSAQERLRQEREHLHQKGLGEISAIFADEIPPELLARHADTDRTRVYSQEVTFWAFFEQVLSEDGSCAQSVARVQQWHAQADLPAPSANTASYVEARQRLPSSMLQSIHHALFTALSTRICSADLWRGHRVKAIDATSVQMPDTAFNQQAYPQPSGQSPGCGFPVVQLVGLIDLIHGGLENFVESPIAVSELRGFDLLLPYVAENEVLVGDRAYSSYEAIARLHGGGAHFVGRVHQSRRIDFRKPEPGAR
ncbi:MAG: transposase [Verrucomicrobiae bacterium]|nr:transposase [Verrucomicrobiae bacterium]